MNSLAIKLDVSDQNQEDLNALLIKIGIKPQRRRFHCTIGFMDKVFKSKLEAEDFVSQLKPILCVDTPIPYHYMEPRFLFRHIIGLIPNDTSMETMQGVNQNLHNVVHNLCGDKYPLNSQTTGEGYHPHITLWRQRHKDRRYRMLRDELAGDDQLQLQLVDYSYTIL